MTLSYKIHTATTGDVSGQPLGYSFNFPSLSANDITVTVGGNTKTITTDYTVENWTADAGNNPYIKFTSSTARGSGTIRISRGTTSTSPTHDFQVGSAIKASDLNSCNKQNIYLAQENRDSLNALALGDASSAIQINSANIANLTIQAEDIKSDAVETAKIKDSNVTTDKINNLAVTTGKIADDAVTTDKLANSINTSITAASFTTGMIMMFTGSSAPSGWAFCDGNNGTPDLRDKFIVGAGTSYSSGDTGGSDSVILNVSEMPQHSHGINLYTQNHTMTGSVTNISQSYAASGSASGVFSKFSSSGQHTPVQNDAGGCDGFNFNGTHSHHVIGSTQNTGSTGAHENRPPYYALSYIMKL